MKKLFTLALLTFGLGMLQAQIDLENGLTAYFKFDEGSGTVAANSAIGTDVAPEGKLYSYIKETDEAYFPVWVNGKNGTALEFNDTSKNSVYCFTFDPTLGGDNLAVACWVKWYGDNGNWQGICGKRNDYTNDGFFFDVSTDLWNSNFVTMESLVADTGVKVATLETLPENEWCHLAVNYDGDAATIYINGIEKATGVFILGNETSRNTDFVIGSITSSDNSFNGAIDEFRTYNRVLSTDEIEALVSGNIPSNINYTYVTNVALGMNPFSVNTELNYSLKTPSKVSLAIYDMNGRLIQSVVEQTQNTGNYTIDFGNELDKGLYIIRLMVNNNIAFTERVVKL